MIYRLTAAQVVELHDRIDPKPLINRAALEGAVGHPEATWDGSPLYPTVIDQAAALLRGIAMSHAFEDGNKRTAWASSQLFLELNGVPLYEVPPNQAADFVVCAVEAHLPVPKIAEWFRDRLMR